MIPSGPGPRGRSVRRNPAASRAAAAARSGSSGSRTAGMGESCQLGAQVRAVGPVGDDNRVPTLTNLARRHTALTAADVDWLQALVSDWQLLADLSFADLVLWAPLQDGSGWVVLTARGRRRTGRPATASRTRGPA